MKPISGISPKALIFDWDNTLIDTWGLLHEALRLTFLDFGVEPWTAEETRTRVRQSAREAFPRLFAERSEEATACYIAHYRSVSRGRLRGLDGSGTFIERAATQGRGPLAVVSNKTGVVLRQEAAQLGWSDYFQCLVGAGDAVSDKPAVAPVEMALTPSGLRAGPEVWFIGDTDIDLLCARNAGCTAILFRPEEPGDGEFADCEPAFHVRNFHELDALLQQHGFFKPWKAC